VRRCGLARAGRRVSAAVLCNLGAEGAYVTFLPPVHSMIPEVGESVSFSFLLPGDPVPVEGEAVVEWRNLEGRQTVDGLPVGCALRFAPLRPDDERRLADLIEDYRHASQPRIAVPAPHTGFIRVPYVEPCLLVSDQGTREGVLCNLSRAGAFVTLEPIPPLGEQVRLFFKTPGRPEPVVIDGEVAWINSEGSPKARSLPPGCGVRFLDREAAAGEIELLVLEYESLPRDV
jgi:Tfp pilus assembly protein PilZ